MSLSKPVADLEGSELKCGEDCSDSLSRSNNRRKRAFGELPIEETGRSIRANVMQNLEEPEGVPLKPLHVFRLGEMALSGSSSQQHVEVGCMEEELKEETIDTTVQEEELEEETIDTTVQGGELVEADADAEVDDDDVEGEHVVELDDVAPVVIEIGQGEPQQDFEAEEPIAVQVLELDWAHNLHTIYRDDEVIFRIEITHLHHIDPNERFMMVNWMENVRCKRSLTFETLFLAVNLMDRVLQGQNVSLTRFYTVGKACLFMAAKFEELRGKKQFRLQDLASTGKVIESPEVNDILTEELWICSTLQHQFMVPTAFHFLCQYLQASVNNSSAMVQLACFLSERMLHEFDMLRFLPSITAATIVRTCRKTFQMQPFWSPALAMCTQYEETALEECATVLRGIVATPLHPESVVFKKYSRTKCHEVALLVVIV
jgi:hypothetical protein